MNNRTRTMLCSSLSEGHVVCCIWIVSDDGNRNKFSVRVEHTARPIDVISEVIRRRGRLMDITKAQVEGLIESYRSTYALKVCGCDEFLLSEKPISQYRVSFRWQAYFSWIMCMFNPSQFCTTGNILVKHFCFDIHCRCLLLQICLWKTRRDYSLMKLTVNDCNLKVNLTFLLFSPP